MENQVYLLSVQDILVQSWEKIKGSKASIWAAFAIIFVIMFGIGLVSGLLKNGAPALSGTLNFIGQVINYLLQVGILYIGIARASDLPITYKMMFRTFEFDLGLKVIGLYLLQIAIFIPVAIIGIIAAMLYKEQFLLSGLLFLISVFAVIYLAIRLFLTMGFIVDKNVGPIKAIYMSFKATRGNFWRIAAILFLQFCIMIVSAIPLGIGLIWTLPFSLIVYGMIYKNLLVNLNNP